MHMDIMSDWFEFNIDNDVMMGICIAWAVVMIAKYLRDLLRF